MDLAENLARRGYATAVMKYTLGEINGSTWLQSFLDMKAAVKFFKKYATEYEIDPNNIFTGGWSTGAQLALYTSHMDIVEFENIQQETIHTILDTEIEEHGVEPALYESFTSDVKGNILLMPYAWEEDFIDDNGPATLMIANPNSTFNDGTPVWGEIFSGGISQIGPDLMLAEFENHNYVDGQNVELILTSPGLDNVMDHINYTPLAASYFDDIAEFIERNLD